MVTDAWPNQEGVIVKGLICGFAYADGVIAANSWVTWGTSATNRWAVTASAAVGDSQGMAMRAAAAAGDIIPVIYSGIVKSLTNETIVIGDLLVNESTTEVVGFGASTTLEINSATQYILGTAAQADAAPGGEILILLGHY
jgi:hypothetical protein